MECPLSLAKPPRLGPKEGGGKKGGRERGREGGAQKSEERPCLHTSPLTFLECLSSG